MTLAERARAVANTINPVGDWRHVLASKILAELTIVRSDSLAHVRAVLTRDSLAEMLHKAWANGVSTWEDDKIIQPAFYRQADAILALLDAAGT